MIVPGVRRRSFHVPHAAVTVALGVSAISITIGTWAVWSPSPAGLDSPMPAAARVTDIRSIAYTVPGVQFDQVMVRPAGGGLERVVASFPSSGLTNVHARGAASPRGDLLVMLWVPGFSTAANVSLVDLGGAEASVRDISGLSIDPLSPIAWSQDGSRFAVTRTARSNQGDEHTFVLEVDVASLSVVPVAEYTGVLDVAPVGYSFDGQRLFVVVVDQKGSNLHGIGSGGAELVAELSPGRTRDWTLSPDAARLAFVDILGGGSRTFVGRTLLIATGQITTLPAERNQFGAAWLPGSPSPGFGGPGGDWQLTDPGAEGTVLVPNAWSPDGAYLVATLNTTVAGAGPLEPPAIELISRETATAQSTRVRISEASGAAFLGWVADLD